MRWEVERAGVDAHVALEGSLDVYSVTELRACLQEVVRGGGRHLTVDVGAVSFVDAASLGVFVAAHRRVEALGGSIAVVNADEQVRAPFEVTGLSARFGLADPD